MRGKERFRAVNVLCKGITPAYAGKSPRNRSPQWLCRDHPRLCGEKLLFPLPTVRVIGSPPPMRGKAELHEDRENWHGITPAYAGKRCVTRAAKKLTRDHPRLCGEKIDFIQIVIFIEGSPPPMRGKGRCVVRRHTGQRITPAYAGKSQAFCLAILPMWDHPRLCGEKMERESTGKGHTGSPPPMRGKARWSWDTGSGTGITPAYAGKSFFGSRI